MWDFKRFSYSPDEFYKNNKCLELFKEVTHDPILREAIILRYCNFRLSRVNTGRFFLFLFVIVMRLKKWKITFFIEQLEPWLNQKDLFCRIVCYEFQIWTFGIPFTFFHRTKYTQWGLGLSPDVSLELGVCSE